MGVKNVYVKEYVKINHYVKLATCKHTCGTVSCLVPTQPIFLAVLCKIPAALNRPLNAVATAPAGIPAAPAAPPTAGGGGDDGGDGGDNSDWHHCYVQYCTCIIIRTYEQEE